MGHQLYKQGSRGGKRQGKGVTWDISCINREDREGSNRERVLHGTSVE